MNVYHIIKRSYRKVCFCGRCNAQYALLVQLRDNAVSETINNPIVDLQLLLKP